MPTRDHADHLRVATFGVLERTSYPALELIVVDNGSIDADALDVLALLERDPRCRILRDEGPFNFSRLTNAGIAVARGSILLLLNNDIEVIDEGWLAAMVAHFSRPEVAIVGVRLLYPDRRLQHAGVAFGPGEDVDHRWRFAPGDAPDAPAEALEVSSIDAVTGACLAIRAELANAWGGLDEAFPSSFNDIDLCLRARAARFEVVYAGDIVLIHHEGISRGGSRTRSEWIVEVNDRSAFWRKHAHFALFGRLAVAPPATPDAAHAAAGSGWLF